MFNKLQDFKRQGYLLITNLEREDAIKELKHVMNHFPKFDSRSGDYSSHTKQFECFYYTLSKAYPKIFLMKMYGIHTLWEYIQGYRQDTLIGNMNIYQASVRIYEIINFLYQSLPNFININEMPSFNLEHKFATALAADAVKANTKNETIKKIESGLLLSKDFADSFKANSIKQYYENLKAQLEREYILKNYTRCAFEEHLLQKCNAEIAKCNEAYELSLLSGINNAAEIID